jgi:hypothetical protein
MRCPKPCKEGRECTWEFPFGASGPFGEETVGVWKTAEEILLEIQAYWNNPALDANIHGWYDLHARLADIHGVHDAAAQLPGSSAPQATTNPQKATIGQHAPERRRAIMMSNSESKGD